MAERGLDLQAIWLTHAHIDHAGGAGQLARETGLPIVGPHRGDQFWIDALAQQAQMFRFAPAEAFVPTRWLDRDPLRVFVAGFGAGTVWRVLEGALEGERTLELVGAELDPTVVELAFSRR